MKIAAKVSAGYAILIALIVGALAYELSLTHQMQSINQDLSGINFRAAILSLQLLRDLDLVEEFTQKYFATGGDTDYASQLEDMKDAVSREVKEMESLHLSAVEHDEVGRLSRLWSEFSKSSSSNQQLVRSRKARQMESALSDQLKLFGRLRIQAQTVILATRDAVRIRVQESSRAAQGAQRIAWLAAAAALALSLLVSVWIIRSISEPLRSLTEGTRAVAEGKLFWQLDTTGKDELAELAKDFNSMTLRLRELDEMKKDFVSHVSHELKAPLASILEVVRLLLEEIPGPLNEQQKHFLELSTRSGKRLSALISDLLDMSRMEAGMMQYEIHKHDLAALARTVLTEFEVTARGKSVRLDAQFPLEPVSVECDGDRIIQVVGNLLGNALKFSPHHSTVQVSLTHRTELPDHVPNSRRERMSRIREAESFALLSVADSGPGIPASERERIFEKFHQVWKGAKNLNRGAGLGLAIARTVVEAHGGAIWMEDNPGGGSVFYVVLSAEAVAAPVAVRNGSLG